NGYSINNKNQVVGFTTNNTIDKLDAYIWDRGVMNSLNNPLGKHSIAYSINDQSQIVGVATDQSGKSHAVMWEGQDMKDLGLITDSFFVRENKPIDINNSGQVFVNSNFTTYLLDGTDMKDLMSMSTDANVQGILSSAINDQGQIVGQGWEIKDPNNVKNY